MFSQRVIQRNIERFEAAESARLTALRGTTTRFRIHRHSSADIEEMVEHLKTITDKATGTFTRDRTSTEQSFIDNEQVLCRLDWRHFAENYCYIQLAGHDSSSPAGWDELDQDPGASEDKGIIGRFILNGMQESLLLKMAELEEREFDAYDRGAPVNGVLLITLKARALGASMFWQSVGYLRTAFYSNVNGLTGSMDDQSTQRMHRRYERIHEYLPHWLRPDHRKWTQDRGVVWSNGSIMELQDGMQKTDMGKSEAWHFWHVTEASMFPRPEDHFDEGLFPATPIGMYGGFPVYCGLETTAKGKLGWFKDFWDQVCSGEARDQKARAQAGAGRFDWFFAPFYLIDIHDEGEGQRSKYRLAAPIDWKPSPSTELMAKKAYESSPDYTPDHRAVTLHRDVLYWYETTRQMYYLKGRLNVFLQSWPLTHDEAFQHQSTGAFSSETIERLDRVTAKWRPWVYRIFTKDEADSYNRLPYAFIDKDCNQPLPTFTVSSYIIGPAHPSEQDKDPRGFIYFWELPDDRLRNYVVSCDPTGGIPNWQRAFREHSDVNVDNGVVQVWRRESQAAHCPECKGVGWLPTSSSGVQSECLACDARGRIGGRAVQCAEFAAPIDAESIALYVFILGRVFKTLEDFDDAKAIVAVANTGILTVRTLQTVYGHTNLWRTHSESGVVSKVTAGIGFLEGPSSVPVLHARGHTVTVKRDVEIRSKWMVKELSDAIRKVMTESGRERFEVPKGGGRHDDRMTTGFLGWWAIFHWFDSPDGDGDPADLLPPAPVPDYASQAISAEDMQEKWNELVDMRVGDTDLTFGDYEHGPDCEPWCEGCRTEAEDPVYPEGYGGSDSGGGDDDDFGVDEDGYANPW